MRISIYLRGKFSNVVMQFGMHMCIIYFLKYQVNLCLEKFGFSIYLRGKFSSVVMHFGMHMCIIYFLKYQVNPCLGNFDSLYENINIS
jgi:hypothetical protein